MLWLRTILFTFLVPGTEFVVIPYLLLRRFGSQFDLGHMRLLALIFLTPGVAIITWCFIDFIRRGRGTPAPLRSTSAIGRRGAVSVRAQPAIHRRGARPVERSSFLRELGPARLRSILRDWLSSLCALLRRADSQKAVRRRLRSLLCDCSALDTEARPNTLQP